MSKGNGKITTEQDYEKTLPDIMGKGFHKLDPKILTRKPPKITWSSQFRKLSAVKKAAYLEKLANTMNHAAALIQDERDNLNKILAMKEEQIRALVDNQAKSHEALNHEILRMNKERQQWQKASGALQQELREAKRTIAEHGNDD